MLKMSVTRIEKYSERGYILKNLPGRLLIVTYWTALGAWLTPGGRQFEPTKSPFGHADIRIFRYFSKIPLLTVTKPPGVGHVSHPQTSSG